VPGEHRNGEGNRTTSYKERAMTDTRSGDRGAGVAVREAHLPTPGADAELRARFDRDVTPLIDELYRHARRLTRNHVDAEDLVQDTLVKAYSGFHAFRPDSNLAAWLHRILLNTYINGYRKMQRRPVHHPTEEITDRQLAVAAQHSSSGLASAEDQALQELPDHDIKAAMHALTEQFRVTVYYADVEGRGFKEIARLTGSPIGTVTSRLHRGRRQLRRLLAAFASERGYRAAQTLGLQAAG
jgi:RNA polymerase sigma-70 factor (ECF subfamily)